MSSVAGSSPVKAPKGIFSKRTGTERIPLTPSPRNSLNLNSSLFSPENAKDSKPTYSGNLMAHYGRASSTANSQRDSQRDSQQEPQRESHRGLSKSKALALGVSDYALTGTSLSTSPPAPKNKKGSLRQQPGKTTVNYTGDRFIPNRTASSAIANTGSSKASGPERKKKSKSSSSERLPAHESGEDDGEAASALEGLSILDEDDEDEGYVRPSPNTAAYQDSLANACGVSLKTRILEFKPPAPESSKPIDLRQQYNRPLRQASSGSAQTRRRIATAPERVLDAPGLIDDYYLNLLDWSSGNQVAIGLERSVYVWSADEGSVDCLMETTPDTYISSVKWSEDGAYVGVGLGTGEVQIWDVAESQKIRSMFGHDTRVGVMGWSKHLLSTGARSGLVFNHDVRIAEHKIAELVSHTSEVCGLEWRSDGAQLATGGNDNLVSIWDARSLTVPKFTKTNHKAAVKALAWCPWNANLLATGGGSYDRHIHFWNSTTGARVNSIDTGSQVTSLRWSTHYREIVSSSGFPDNSLSIWSYPTMVRNVEIPAHDSRVLHSCLSPDGQMLATAAADESLKFWKIFEKKAGSSAGAGGAGASAKAAMAKQMTIR
ncbi:WD40-repeat-containing domain protein [Trichoderma austrokoningii]